jgi:cytochrome c oxidase assembly protein subunit 15
MPAKSQQNPWLHRFALFTALATLFLIGMGGLVTSKGVGMAVPDWPNTFGYNMFLVPFDHWIGQYGIFEEHAHRLIASFVGLLTSILLIWLLTKESRAWVRRSGIGAFILVLFQGLLGGLRVTEINPNLGLIHGAMAQVFFIVVCGIALFTSSWWKQVSLARELGAGFAKLQGSLFILIFLIFAQLLLGATMRHQHAGLAIWDFPLAHGQLWPSTNSNSVDIYNKNRLELQNQLYSEQKLFDADGNPRTFLTSGKDIDAWHVWLQMIHRVGAVITLGAVGLLVVKSRRRLGHLHWYTKITYILMVFIVAQGCMGIWTVLSNKAADVATGHVILGAICLALTSLLLMIAKRCVFISRAELISSSNLSTLSDKKPSVKFAI